MKISANTYCYICFPKPRSQPTDIGRPRDFIVKINLDFAFGRETYHQKASIISDKAVVCPGARRRAEGDGRREMEAAIRFLASSSRM
jgi:hypothetical protein